MSQVMWIATGATAVMIAGHLLLFWWFLVKRPGDAAARDRNTKGSGPAKSPR